MNETFVQDTEHDIDRDDGRRDEVRLARERSLEKPTAITHRKNAPPGVARTSLGLRPRSVRHPRPSLILIVARVSS